jgi:hypothetical protein
MGRKNAFRRADCPPRIRLFFSALGGLVGEELSVANPVKLGTRLSIESSITLNGGVWANSGIAVNEYALRCGVPSVTSKSATRYPQCRFRSRNRLYSECHGGCPSWAVV